MSAGGAPAYLAGLLLAGRPVVAVGGGAVHRRRVPVLLAAGAVVTVVAPQLHPDLAALADAGTVRWVPRAFEQQDLARRRVDDDEDGDGLLVGRHAAGAAGCGMVGSQAMPSATRSTRHQNGTPSSRHCSATSWKMRSSVTKSASARPWTRSAWSRMTT